MTDSTSHPILTPEFLASVAGSSGVYLMKDAQGEVLYAGKAKSLRKRLSSYLRQTERLHTKTGVLLSKVAHIETILTHTEKEALILEASLIKKHRPKYNIILRDDKNYPLIKITVQEEWPRLVMTRRRVNDGARYFGPFSSPAAMWRTIEYLRSLFPLRTCKERKIKSKPRPCLNYQMKRCLAPCAGRIDKTGYLEMVGNILMVLEGRNRQLIRELEKKMRQEAEAMNFENAALVRDQIRALEGTLEKQQMVAAHSLDQDIFGLAREESSVAVSVIFVRKGTVTGHQSFFLSQPLGTDREILAEVVERFYQEERPIPQEILLPARLENGSLIADWLGDRRGGKVTLKVPERGGGVRLVSMAEANAGQVFADLEKKEAGWQQLAADLMKCLRLRKSPDRIHCIDISNLGGSLAVGSVVCFEHGEKKKEGYRHYKMKRTSGPDDYGMMAEVLERHFERLRATGEFPDLLLVDGGKGQLNVARSVVSGLDLSAEVELAGIAKERETEGEKIYRPGRKNPILLPRHSPILLFFMRVRDEAHRFGISFHRSLRTKKDFSSVLDELPGVGPARKEALLRELGSVTRVETASEEELAEVPGISRSLARRIWLNFHGKP
jgi:excinuclease ABC subunit C